MTSVSAAQVRAELIGIVMLLISVCGDAMAPNLQARAPAMLTPAT